MSDTTATLNEVDIDAVARLAAKLREDPDSAEITWQASVHWNGGFRSEASIRDFEPTPSDQPPGLGGADGAPNPVEQLLAALGHCLAVGYAANATVFGIALDALSIDVEGDLNLRTFLGLEPSGHAGFRDVRATVHLSSNATDEQLAELHARVIETSPVGHTLARAIPVDIGPA